jgi:hypothetical protein
MRFAWYLLASGLFFLSYFSRYRLRRRTQKRTGRRAVGARVEFHRACLHKGLMKRVSRLFSQAMRAILERRRLWRAGHFRRPRHERRRRLESFMARRVTSA